MSSSRKKQKISNVDDKGEKGDLSSSDPAVHLDDVHQDHDMPDEEEEEEEDVEEESSGIDEQDEDENEGEEFINKVISNEMNTFS
jgi:hypothetical protein